MCLHNINNKCSLTITIPNSCNITGNEQVTESTMALVHIRVKSSNRYVYVPPCNRISFKAASNKTRFCH